MEQGVAEMTDCNVSNNALTGILAMSRENAFLMVTGSDLYAAGAAAKRDRESKEMCKDNVVATLGDLICLHSPGAHSFIKYQT